ncbi:MAG: hypothetical protein ACTSVY_11460 [Candidatus Helarchaeota archaeon]
MNKNDQNNSKYDVPADNIRLGVMANLLRMFIEIYADEKRLKILDGLNGDEIQIEFPNLGGSILFKIYDRRIIESVGSSEDAVATLVMEAPVEGVVKDLSPVLANSNGIFGVLKLLFNMLKGGVASRGSKMKALKFMRVIMMGNSEEIKKQKRRWKLMQEGKI